MIEIIVNILIAACLGLAFVNFIYTSLIKTDKLIIKYGQPVTFLCKKCGQEHIYSKEEAVKILKKPRNYMSISRRTGIIGIYRIEKKISFRYPCSVCKVKTMQMPISNYISEENIKKARKEYLISFSATLLFIIAALASIAIKENLL